MVGCSVLQSACLSVCLLAYLNNHIAKRHQLFYAFQRGSVLVHLCQCCSTFTSVNEVTFLHMSLCDASCAFVSCWSISIKLLHQFQPNLLNGKDQLVDTAGCTLQHCGKICGLQLPCSDLFMFVVVMSTVARMWLP